MARTRSGVSESLEAVSSAVTRWTGSSIAFGGATSVVLLWALLGPRFHYSNTWQLVINTGTTIVTFLMVFLIQRSQNKDALAGPSRLRRHAVTFRRRSAEPALGEGEEPPADFEELKPAGGRAEPDRSAEFATRSGQTSALRTSHQDSACPEDGP